MDVMEQLRRLGANLLQLGTRKLLALAAIGIAVFGLTGIVGYYLSRPSMEVLYAGLDRQDVSSIGAALHEADIGFDVSADERGRDGALRPDRAGAHAAGREGPAAFDERRLRALRQDGVARPHLLHAGCDAAARPGGRAVAHDPDHVGHRAARVHIVLPDEGSFRRTKQPASASVVIRAATLDDTHTAQAIRHLVASAVPGMTPDQVTVLSTDGAILASGDDAASAAPGRMLDLEQLGQQVHPGQRPARR